MADCDQTGPEAVLRLRFPTSRETAFCALITSSAQLLSTWTRHLPDWYNRARGGLVTSQASNDSNFDIQPQHK